MITKLQSGRLVQFLDGDDHHVGNVLELHGREYQLATIPEATVFVRMVHTGDIVPVEADRLSKYPEKPIPEPTNVGRQP